MVGARRTAEALVELADALSGAGPRSAVLQDLTDRSRQVLTAHTAGLLLTAPVSTDVDPHRLHIAATSSPTTGAHGLLQLQVRHDTLLHSLSERGAVLDMNLRTCARHWPGFAQAALTVGVRSVSALPLHTGGRFLGVLVLFHAHHDPADAATATLTQLVADVLTLSLILEPDSAAHGAPAVGPAPGRGRRPILTPGTQPPSSGVDVVPLWLDEDDLAVLRLLAAEHSTTAIAATVGVPLQELATRLISIRTRLGVTSTTAAVERARHAGLL